MRLAFCFAASLALVAAGTPAAAQQGGRVASITVRAQNALPIARTDETIALAWSGLRQRLPALAANAVRVRDAGGTELVSQLLDADGDGTPDSLLFQASFWPNEAKTFTVEAAAPTVAQAPRVHVKYVPERSDVAWESDRIAFRVYGELLWKLENLHSSASDVWVKRTRKLVLDDWYSHGHDYYHLDRGEGADFYKAGPTLGGGATAIWKADTMYRAENFHAWRIIADGPIRAIFELDFAPWNAGGTMVTETKRISIDAGQNMYRQESTFRATGADSVTYVLGFVKRPGLIGSESRARKWAWLTGWGPVDNKFGEGGHGELGTAVMLERSRELDVKETNDHYLAVARARSGEPVVHWIGAGWTGSRDFTDVESWWSYLDGFARRLESPLAVSLVTTTAMR